MSGMPLSPRQQAAALFREQIRLSNELHDDYLGNPQLLINYERFADWQLQHLLPFFADLYEQPGYADAIDFTMHDLAGVEISDRDRDLERASPAITRILPLGALETIANAAEMNARILKSNIAICRALMVDNELPVLITEVDYCIACREASSLEELVELVHLVVGLGRTLKSLVHTPMIGMTLRAMRAPAHATGFGALQDFLERGYSTFKQIPDIDLFLSEIEDRMVEVFTQIQTAPLDRVLSYRSLDESGVVPDESRK